MRYRVGQATSRVGSAFYRRLPGETPPPIVSALLYTSLSILSRVAGSPAHHFPSAHNKVRKQFETIEDWVGISDRWGNSKKKAAVQTLLRAIGDRLGNATALGAPPNVALWFTHDSTLQPLLSR